MIAPDHDVVRGCLQRFAVADLPKGITMGRENGEYSIAKLKSYPPLFCRSLASIAETWACEHFFVPANSQSDQDFLAYVARLRCGFNISAQRGQDYACN